MKRFFTFVGIIVVVFVISFSCNTNPEDYIPTVATSINKEQNRKYIIKLSSNASVDNFMNKYNSKRKYTKIMNGFAAELTDEQLNELKRNPNVLKIEQDHVITIDTSTIIPVELLSQSIEPGIRRINVIEEAKIDGIDERVDVDIAIIDTGVDPDHPDINLYRAVSFISEDELDYNGHGTHCAGIAAAIDNNIGVVGVAPGARIWSLKVLDAGGRGHESTILEALDYVINNAEIDVVSMSLGGYFNSSFLEDALRACFDIGITTVAAAGNSYAYEVYGLDLIQGTNDDFSPASNSTVVTISATVESDGYPGGLGPEMSFGKDDDIAVFSNSSGQDGNNVFGLPSKTIEFAAPGVNILSTIPGGGYGYKSGTSMACPHVAGFIGLWISKHGRPINGNGVVDMIHQINNVSEPQSHWRDFVSDPDGFRERLISWGVVEWPDDPPPTISYPIYPIEGDTVYYDSTVFRWTQNDWGGTYIIINKSQDFDPSQVIWYHYTNDTIFDKSGYEGFPQNSVVWWKVYPWKVVNGVNYRGTPRVASYYSTNGTPSDTTTPPEKDTIPPTINFIYPQNEDSLIGDVVVKVNATDNYLMSHVKFLLNNENIAIDSLAPYSFVWNTDSYSDGTYSLSATAYDTSGLFSTTNITVYLVSLPPIDTCKIIGVNPIITSVSNYRIDKNSSSPVSIIWQDNTENEEYFSVEYRIKEKGNKISEWLFFNFTSMNFVEMNVDRGTQIQFRVSAILCDTVLISPETDWYRVK